jgi:1,4-dihydroxy-6-naphthoate synthase
MFYGLATRKVRSAKVSFKHVLEDIETAISYHAYPAVADKYVLMASGSSIGDGYGPLVIALRPMDPEELKGKRIAVPGTLTTAYLAARLFQPDFEAVVTPFDKITAAVRERAVDAGIIIHEAQLTFDREGFHRIADLGRWFKSSYGLPLPLGANALLRSLDPEIKSECCRLMRESIQYALDNRDEALEYALQFARDMDPALAEKFVGMYVNHYTLDAGDVVPRAAQKLFDLGYEAGLIPNRVEVEFVR